ncbi:uncharacterized membrane protein-like protein [Tanacetum coccineum]
MAVSTPTFHFMHVLSNDGSNILASDIGVVENVATRECPFDYPPDALIDVGSQPPFLSTVATSTSMMSASDSVSIKEDNIVNVMVIVQRHNNVLMIVPLFESVPTGCQRTRCLLPMSLDGIVLRCEDSSKLHVIPV